MLNGSLNNGNSAVFAQPRGFANNRPRPPAGVYSYAAGLQLGNAAWDARPFSLITGIDQDPRNWGPTSLTFASDLAGLTDGRCSSTINRTHLWSGEIARFKGSHSVTAGGEIRRQANDVAGQPDPRGSFGFTGNASGVDFADFFLGPHSSSIAFGNPDKHFWGGSYAAFLTDDWRVKPSLTLNRGPRWHADDRSPGTTRQPRCRARVHGGSVPFFQVRRGGSPAGTTRTRSCRLTRAASNRGWGWPGARRSSPHSCCARATDSIAARTFICRSPRCSRSNHRSRRRST